MVTNLKNLTQKFSAAAGNEEEVKAEARNAFGIWTVDPEAEIANEVTRAEQEELTQGEAGVHETLHVTQRDRNEQVNRQIQKEQEAEFIKQQGDKNRALETKKHNLSLDPDRLEAAGMIKTANAANKGYKSDIEKQRKERRFQNLLNRLEQQRRMWEERLQWLESWYLTQAKEKEQKAQELRQEIADNIGRMQENSTFISEVSKMLKAHKNGEPVDKEKLRQLLKEHGEEVSETATLTALLYKAENLMKAADAENATLDKDNYQYEEDIEKLDEAAAQDREKAAAIHQQLEDLKSQNLSDEEYNNQAEKIWEDVQLEVKRQYENNYGGKETDKEVAHENSAVRKAEVVSNPMAQFGIQGKAESTPNETVEFQPTVSYTPGM